MDIGPPGAAVTGVRQLLEPTPGMCNDFFSQHGKPAEVFMPEPWNFNEARGFSPPLREFFRFFC